MREVPGEHQGDESTGKRDLGESKPRTRPSGCMDLCPAAGETTVAFQHPLQPMIIFTPFKVSPTTISHLLHSMNIELDGF